MKVLDLACQHGHVFEGWFGSEGDFQDQLARSLLTCPACGSAHITKQLSAPRLNLSASSPPPVASASHTEPHSAQDPAGQADGGASRQRELAALAEQRRDPAVAAQWNALVTTALRVVVASTEDVGAAFPQEVRRMHRGEVEAKAIRGRTSAAEAHALREEGIAIMALPQLDGPQGTLQ